MIRASVGLLALLLLPLAAGAQEAPPDTVALKDHRAAVVGARGFVRSAGTRLGPDAAVSLHEGDSRASLRLAEASLSAALADIDSVLADARRPPEPAPVVVAEPEPAPDPPPVVEDSAPAPPAELDQGRTFQVPASIAADCSVDVSAELLAWIATAPDSSTFVFGAGACYNIDRGLKIYDRWGLTFEGNGATFRRVSRGVTQQSNFHFAGGGGLTIRDLILRGANPNAGEANEAAYVVELENQHGIYLAGIQGALIEDVQVYDVFGDFIAMTHDYRLLGTEFPGLPNRDVLIRRGHFERNGRMGVAVTHGERITLEDSYIGDVRWSAFDLELDDSREIGRDIVIQRNRFGLAHHYAIISAGAGTPEGVRNITIRGNVMAYTPPTCLGVVRVRGKGWPGWLVEGNTLTTRGGGLGIEFTGVADAVARGNTITSGAIGGCAQPAPILVQGSQQVTIEGNTVTGPWPKPVNVDAVSTGVTETATVR